MNTYVKLQSGFLSYKAVDLIKPVRKEDIISSNILSKDYRDITNSYHYHKEVVSLFNSWAANNALLRDFTFRENILKVAKEVFHTTDFSNWLSIQIHGKMLSTLHSSFLLETLDYIYNGKPRSINVTQWVRLLNYSSFINEDKGIVENNFLSIGNANPGINYMLVNWVKNENGFQDLLVSLYVIFGDRSSIDNVADKRKD